MEETMKKTRVWPVVLTAAIITAIALAAVFGPDVLRYFRARNMQNDLREMYKGLLPVAIAEEEQPAIHEDFAQLYQANPHLVGWLSAGETIDYPVVQHDNAFYLDHDYFGNRDNNGTLFLNAANQLAPRDSILLIHGHNMKSGAMFGDLDAFRDCDYLSEHPIVTFRTIWDEQDVHYVPVAAFDASMTPGAEGYFNIGRIRFEFEPAQDETTPPTSAELETYLAQIRQLSFWTSPVEADSTDRFIALVTCSYSHDNGRMLLLCRQLREGESPETIKELFFKQ